MADITLVEYKPDPDPRKQDHVHITIKFRKDEVGHAYYLEIAHQQGTVSKEKPATILHNVVRIVPKEELWLHIQPIRKIKKIFKVPEQIKFNVRIFQACGIAQSKKYDITIEDDPFD